MWRRVKVSPEIKIKIVEDYLEGRFSISGSYTGTNVSKATFEEWIRKYRFFDPDGLITRFKNWNKSVSFTTDLFQFVEKPPV